MFSATGKLLPDPLTWHVRVVSYVQHIPWILPIGMLVPGLRSKLARLESFYKGDGHRAEETRLND